VRLHRGLERGLLAAADRDAEGGRLEPEGGDRGEDALALGGDGGGHVPGLGPRLLQRGGEVGDGAAAEAAGTVAGEAPRLAEQVG
jgi:hypothetical protein